MVPFKKNPGNKGNSYPIKNKLLKPLKSKHRLQTSKAASFWFSFVYISTVPRGSVSQDLSSIVVGAVLLNSKEQCLTPKLIIFNKKIINDRRHHSLSNLGHLAQGLGVDNVSVLLL